ncbi:MAG TPA: arsenite efflux transporter metallochaperone ArsD [Terriglobales bacterium]
MARSLPLENPGDAIPGVASPLSGTIAIYDPAMCCSTGVCGPAVDPSLLAIARDLRWLEKRGVTVERHGLSQEPDIFVKQPKIAGLMQAFGDKGLPATLVNGDVLTYGRYPSREEITAVLSAETHDQNELANTDDGDCGCAPGSKCC